MISKRRILPLILLTGLLAGCGGPEDGDVLEEPGTRENGAEGYGAYTMVVTAWDTPGEVIEELRSLGVEYTEYYDGSLLLWEETAALGDKASIYLCEGTYEVDAGDFIQADGTNELLIRGAGADKTVIRANSGIRRNRGAALNITGAGGETVTVTDLSISGFEVGIQIRDARGVTLDNLFLTQNRFAGIRLVRAADCRINRCLLQENGLPERGDVGYGLMLDAESYGNSGSGNGYLNNGNRNAVDCPSLWSGYTDNENEILLAEDYTMTAGTKMLKDPVIEAQNARPGADSLRFEAEDGGYYGAAVVSGGKIPGASGGKYAVLHDGALFFRVDVPEEGYYRVFVVGGSEDGNSKCDKVSVNGGTEYLVSFPWQGEVQWQLSQPGLEIWKENVLTPEPPAEGFWFEEGENMITVAANWGYCAYDCVYLEKIGGSGMGD
mgnify:FL=1